MPLTLATALHSAGGAARVSQLAALGIGRQRVSTALRRGDAVRVCRGWVATPAAPRSAIRAVLHHGILTGPAALASHGIWDGTDRRLHLRMGTSGIPTQPRASTTPLEAFSAERFPRTELRQHFVAPRAPDPHEFAWRDTVLDALRVSARILPDVQMLACVESALHQNKLTRAGIPTLFTLLPARLRPLRDLADGRAESGLETIARMHLRGLARSIQPQAWIDGIGPRGEAGRVDLLLDGWLVVELDGDEFHDLAADRRRDAALVRHGYRRHRFGYEQVVFGADEMVATVRELLRYPPRWRR